MGNGRGDANDSSAPASGGLCRRLRGKRREILATTGQSKRVIHFRSQSTNKFLDKRFLEEFMVHPGRQQWRLFCLAVSLMLSTSACFSQSPALTTVTDTIYRADGTPATGTLLISWPAFTTADGHAVAAGTKSVAIVANGSFTAQMAPNAGAAPSGVVYTVVDQLNDG